MNIINIFHDVKTYIQTEYINHMDKQANPLLIFPPKFSKLHMGILLTPQQNLCKKLLSPESQHL